MSLNRLALAAALLEYDNDNPASGLGVRSARESAIIRGAIQPPPDPIVASRNNGHEGDYGYVGDGDRRTDDHHAQQNVPIEAETDMGEIDLASWDLPDTFLPRPLPPPSSSTAVKPSLTAQERRALRKGRTVSFHGFAELQAQQDEQIEQLEEATEGVKQEEEVPQRPRSSQSIMSRGRPTSPFESVAASPLTIPLPASPSPYAPRANEQEREEDDPNPFALPAPAGPKLSRFDPKPPPSDTRARPSSLASGYFPPPPQSHPAPAPLSPTRLRPRTLIMPTPLHGALDPLNSAPSRWDTAQFTHGAKPLPPGALTRPDSFVGRMNTHATPFDKTRDLFRMSLAVGQTADHQSYGINNCPPVADQEGIIAVRQYGGEDTDSAGGGEEEEDPDGWRPETRSAQGLSLMDRLEARKRELKSKNRQFRGDNRPAMMSRPSSTLVTLDPSSTDSPRGSLRLHDPAPNAIARPGMPRGKSVFGVDELWERDLRRLEALRAEERAAEALQKGKKGKKGKEGKEGKRRSGGAEEPVHPHTETLLEQGRQETGQPPSISLGDLSAALGPSPAEGAITAPHRTVTVDEWAAGSDEDLAVGAAPRRRKKRVVKPVPVDADDSSEDDVPLAQAFGISRRPVEGDDSSEDEPLSNLKKKVSQTTLDPSDEDDIPLALRRAKKLAPPAAPAPNNPEIDEDDLPLAQRRLRGHQPVPAAVDPSLGHQMAMAQHQSMMMNPMSMYGGMPMMGMGMGMPMGMPSPMAPPPGMIPGAIFPGSPFPVASTALDPGIDRWRREVGAREGSVASGAAPSIVTSGRGS